jgi:hypothetical protein
MEVEKDKLILNKVTGYIQLLHNLREASGGGTCHVNLKRNYKFDKKREGETDKHTERERGRERQTERQTERDTEMH